MLKPQANSTRELVSLDGIWNFALASSPDIEADAPWAKPLPPKLQVPVPASYNDIFADDKIRSHVGWVYYQRRVTVPPSWSTGQRYFLRFDAATHRGRVYVNDKLVVDHAGGYTPFEADITDVVRPGERFRLTVAVSNELSWETIPPGKIETLANGRRKQTYQHDFYNYAGLARSVWLYAKPSTYISDIKIVTTVSDDGAGNVDYEIQTSRPVSDDRLRISILDEEDATVAQANGDKDRVTINAPHLWQPGAAYLYQLRAEILSDGPDANAIVDTYELSFGIRTVEVRGNRFLINGKPFYFTGFGKHEDAPVRGKGFDAAFMVHDFRLMGWTGANSFRTSHYPYAEEFLEYADRHGIVVVDETPAVGLNLGIIAGVLGIKAPPTFAPDACCDATQAAHESAIRELVARDRNHPSVVMWTVANEPASAEPGAREYLAPLVELTRALDPTRPVCFANMGFATCETDRVTDLFDVVCLNRYYGWYSQTGDLEEAERALETDLLGWQARYGKPMFVTEYGAEAVAGLHAVGDVPWSEEYQARFLEMCHRVFDGVDGVVGEHVWNFADFQTTSSITRVDGNKKGVFTRDRRPKSAVHVLRARWTAMQGTRV
ncbi:Putative glycoside hydrolase, family 2, glycoside hydrolase family 2, catalytic [Colletotrichum destructivum]|uniref:Beta-glucuronidase n=1 Tax=Colletotrichum destructivum TaxID=34406 RepID=A0AAX4I8Z3_9PEZI|nr:Putative glycoside hydrolase, family 2, glycoside hydrolase family 2, catalytic [Colletotrichum destructivum]